MYHTIYYDAALNSQQSLLGLIHTLCAPLPLPGYRNSCRPSYIKLGDIPLVSRNL